MMASRRLQTSLALKFQFANLYRVPSNIPRRFESSSTGPTTTVPAPSNDQLNYEIEPDGAAS